MAIAIIAITVTSSAIIGIAIINIATNVDPKSVPVEAPGTLNRLKIGPGSRSGHPEATKSVAGVTRGRLGSVSGRPWRVP